MRGALQQALHVGGQRQVGFPGAREVAARELGVDADDLVHEVDAHLTHELQLG